MTGDTEQTFIRLFGECVQAAGRTAGVSQSRLERDADLRPTTISGLERGEVDMDVYSLYRVACALGVDMRDLLPSHEETATWRRVEPMFGSSMPYCDTSNRPTGGGAHAHQPSADHL